MWTETCNKNTRCLPSPRAVWDLSMSMQYLQAWGDIFHRAFWSIIIQNKPAILWKLFRSWDVTTPDHKIHHVRETNGQCLALWNTVRQKLYLSLLELADHPCSFRLAYTDIPALYITIHQGDLLWNKPNSYYSSLRISGSVDRFGTLWTYIRRKTSFEMLSSSFLYS